MTKSGRPKQGCPICNSPFRKEFEAERMKGRTYKWLVRFIKKKSNRRISGWLVKEHFENHPLEEKHIN